jgi:F0F1-type ATP synthase assembly protein I
MIRKGAEQSSTHRKAIREAGPYLTLGLELGFTMIIWSLIGYLLDRWLDTLPWLTLAGMFIGMISLFLQLARAAKKSGHAMRTDESDR